MREVCLKPRQIARLATCLGAACFIGGCGWTPRDEFYLSREVVLVPQMGDGSQITSTTRPTGMPMGELPQVARNDTAAH